MTIIDSISEDKSADMAECPFVGVSLQQDYNPFSPTQTNDPFPLWAIARAKEPVFYSEVLDCWVVTSFELVQEVLQDSATFRNADADWSKPLPDVVLDILRQLPPGVTALRATDGARHASRRRAIQAAIAAQRPSRMEASIRQVAIDLIDGFHAQGECEFYDAFAYRFPLRVISRLLGLPDEAGHDLHRWANSRVALWWGDLALEQQKRAAQDLVEFHAFLSEAVETRRASPQDDLLSYMIVQNANINEPLSTEELIEAANGLIVAGHESTANWLTQMVFYLLREQAWYRIGESGEAAKILDEALRFDGPVMGIFRKAAARSTIGDVEINAGERVFCALSSANRDESIFPDADGLAIGRPEARRHMAFGYGVHTCIGAPIARLEGRIALETLFQRLKGLRLTSDTLSFAASSSLRLPQHLHLRWSL